jgi:hypothetical protein
MTMWNNPTTEEEAVAIIIEAEEFLRKTDPDAVAFEIACKELALFAGCFNHVWTADHRRRLIDILVNLDFSALNGVLEALIGCARAEQFDVTNSFIRQLVFKYRKIMEDIPGCEF